MAKGEVFSRYFIASLFLLFLSLGSMAQTTEFTYQGQLQNSGTAANGNFDLEFALYDAQNGGAQIGSTLTRSGVNVAGGIFSVNLDFGAAFPGGTRFLEVRVRQAGGGSFTTLLPRQPVSSSPYSIKSLNADNANNATSSQTAVTAQTATSAQTAVTFSGTLSGDVAGTQPATTVARIRGRNVSPNEPNNGQVLKFNTATSQWEPANDETASGGGGGTITGVTAGTGLTGGGTTGSVTLGIANSGVGTTQIADASVTDAKIVGVSGAKITGAVANSNQLGGIAASGFIQNTNGLQASSNFNISGTGTANIFNAGTQFNIGGQRAFSVAGTNNVFAGVGTGASNTGFSNSFFGYFAGNANTDGTSNTFIGANAGMSNISATQNTFIGSSAGRLNVAGTRNTFVGTVAGQTNVNGTNNSFFGNAAGAANTSSNNSFFGAFAGSSNTSGQSNSFFGTSAGDANTTGGNNSFFGLASGIANTFGQRNTFLGSTSGFSNTSGSSNSFVGDGSGNSNTAGNDNTFLGTSAGFGNTGGDTNVFVGFNAGNQNNTGNNNTFVGGFSGQGNTSGFNNTVLGRGTNVSAANLSFATAIGSGASVSTSNTVVLGRASDTVQIPGTLSITGTFDLPTNSDSYIQNRVGQQASSNFNISGNGTAGGTLRGDVVRADTQFNIGSAHVLSRPGIGNIFVGVNAGQSNTGIQNSFVGAGAGNDNTAGLLNSFFGYGSGLHNTTGSSNTYIGADSGRDNQAGAGNTFIGRAAGINSISGSSNAFFGFAAGESNLIGASNTFSGYQSGQENTGGSFNTYYGYRSGTSNLTGSRNTIIGANADLNSGLSYATAIGADASVTTSNTVVLGRSSDSVRIPGDLIVLNGTDAEPGSGGYIVSGTTNSTNVVIDNNEIMARNNGAVATLAINADGGNVHLIQAGTGSVGIGTTTPDQKLSVNGNASKTGGTSWAVFSDERLKNIKGLFTRGIDAIRDLQPIRFEYLPDNPLGLKGVGEQVGFSAQEVQKVLPEAVSTSKSGYLQLNVDPILWTMLNGIKEQQTEIESLKAQIRDQSAAITALRQTLCELNPNLQVCKQ